MMEFMGVGMLLWLLIAALILGIAIYLGVRSGLRAGNRRQHEEDALTQLDRRLARGEIDEDEYHARASALRSMTPSGRHR